uniref:Site-specific DNA-methyltransferase (adenine-specific) n=1 Tax=Haptolina brevifila TaxID=156173 RepID=A0A7S2JLU4_9EUKA|mmetsp:Transcript_85385/g.170447  ORF Transcript_85385/g.170447 Transcript_85385/m.170447 type:complete len:285 (+) Transcript_85385:413-1267(+)
MASCGSAAARPGDAAWVLLREQYGRVHLGWRVASGPAAGPGAPGVAQGRRCYTGWLGQYALKQRRHAAATAMEPEIAFLMANWARISAASRVLDPTCGSCGLLLSAAVLGATQLVGIDMNRSAFEGVAADFSRMALPAPKLVCGDVLAPRHTPELASDALYDAIVCDPPYNLQAPVFVQGSAQTGPLAAADLTSAVLGLAARALTPGGRLVLFVPARGAEVSLTLEELLARRMPPAAHRPALRIVYGRLQRFSTRRSRRAGSSATPRASRGPGAFARWLICLER